MDSRGIARRALEIKAIEFDTKTFFAERRTKKPIFNNLNYFIFDSDDRLNIRDSFIDLLDLDCDIFASISDSGLCLANSLADYLKKDLVLLEDNYIMKRYKRIPDYFSIEGKKVILVEDRIEKGNAINRAICAIKSFGAIAENILTIFDYDYKIAREIFSGNKSFNEYGSKFDPPINVRSLFTFDTLLSVAKEEGYINAEDENIIRLWRDNYRHWDNKYRLDKSFKH